MSSTHAEFRFSGTPGASSRITVMESLPFGPIRFSSHATHVAGTLIAKGFNAELLGMAPNARLSAYDARNDLAEMVDAATTVIHDSLGLLVSNHSYGPVNGWDRDKAGNLIWTGLYTDDGSDGDDVDHYFGKYRDDARAIDGLLCDAPYYLPFYAAGNDGTDGPPAEGGTWYLRRLANPRTYSAGSHPKGDGQYKLGFDLIGGKAIAKNVMTVGAALDAVDSATPPGRQHVGFFF